MRKLTLFIILAFLFVFNVNAQRIAGIGDWVQKGRVVDVRAYGAIGTDSVDDTDQIMAAYNAASAGDTLYFPPGTWTLDNAVTQSLTFAKKIHLKGEGPSSIIYQKLDYDTIIYGTIEYIHVTIKDLYIKSDASTLGKALLNLSDWNDGIIENLVLHGSYYGVYMYGCKGNYIERVITDASDALPKMETMFHIIGGGTESNANTFIGIEARGGSQICDRGIYFAGGGEGGITIIGGVFEATQDIGIEITGTTAGITIERNHFEGNLIDNAIKLSNVTHGSISNNYMTGATMTAIVCYNARQIDISNNRITSTIGSIFADGDCKNVIAHNNTYYVNPVMYGANCYAYDAINYSAIDYVKLGTRGSNYTNLIDGNLDAWTDAPLPIGFSLLDSNYPTKTGTGLADTNKKFGDYAAKIVAGSGKTTEGIKLTLTGDKLNRLIRPKTYNYADQGTAYSWTLSTATGTPPGYHYEYYLRTAGGADPQLPNEPLAVILSDTVKPYATVGALTAGSWDYGDNDSLGYNTLYVRLTDGTDPDANTEGCVQACFSKTYITLAGWFLQPKTDGRYGWIGAKQTGVNSLAHYVSSTYAYADDKVGEWVKLIYAALIDPRTTTLSLEWGLKSSGDISGKIVYIDGLELYQGNIASASFQDGQAIDNIGGGNLRVPGNILQSGTVSTMTGNETFTWGNGEIFIKDPGGANRTFNPSGYFPAFAQVRVINTADAGEKITFDSTFLAEAIWPGQSATFIYSGSAWKRLGGGLTATGSDSTMTGNETFTYLTGERFIKDPGAASRTFNPSGSFPSLYEVHLVNISATYNITFDSTSLAHILTPGKGGIFIYNGSVWKCVASY